MDSQAEINEDETSNNTLCVNQLIPKSNNTVESNTISDVVMALAMCS